MQLATPNLARMWLTWDLTADGLTTSLSAICVVEPFDHQGQHDTLALGTSTIAPAMIQKTSMVGKTFASRCSAKVACM